MAKKRAEPPPVLTDEMDRQIIQALSLASDPLNIQKIRQDFDLTIGEVTSRMERLVKAGLVVDSGKNYFSPVQSGTGIMVVRVTHPGRKLLADGNLGHVIQKPRAIPVNWREDETPPTIILPKSVKRLEVGDRLLVRMKAPRNGGGGQMEARVVKRLGKDQPATLVGKFRQAGSGKILKSSVEVAIDGTRYTFPISGVEVRDHLQDGGRNRAEQARGPEDKRIPHGELSRFLIPDATVAIEIDETKPQFRPKGRLTDIFWATDDDPRPLSALTRKELALRDYTPLTERRMRKLSGKATSLQGREDLRHLPLMTLDGVGSRDFDDAIAVAPDTDPDNPGGYVAHVAVADVAYYVAANSEVDMEARRRGFSIYFPDQAEHMLPKILAENLCSLLPNEERPSLTLEIPYRADGSIIFERCRPIRAVIESKARLTYDEADDALANITPLKNDALQAALLTAGDLWVAIRGRKLERPRLELHDEKIVPRYDGRKIIGFNRLQRNSAAAMIEDLMVDAGQVAAYLLEAKGAPVISRVHETPSNGQMVSLKDKLNRIGFHVPREGIWSAGDISDILRVHQDDHMQYQGNAAVLSCLTAAHYSATKQGHFGLQLDRYAQFTSPIRRYGDLLVHRALIEAYGLGPEKLGMTQQQLVEICDQLGDLEAQTKRTSSQSMQRYELAYLSRDVGNKIPAFVMRVERDHVHLRLNGSPFVRSFPSEIFREAGFIVDAQHRMLVRKEDQAKFPPGSVIDVRLDRAAPVVGDLAITPLTKAGAARTEHPARYGRIAQVKVRHTPTRRSTLNATILSADTVSIVLSIEGQSEPRRFPTQEFLGAAQQRGNALYAYDRREYFKAGDVLPLVAENWREMQLDKATNKYKWHEKVRYTLGRGPASPAIPAAPVRKNSPSVEQLTSHFSRTGANQLEVRVSPNKPGQIEIDMRIGWMAVTLPEHAIILPEGQTLRDFWSKGGMVMVMQHPETDEDGLSRFTFTRSGHGAGYGPALQLPAAANDGGEIMLPGAPARDIA